MKPFFFENQLFFSKSLTSLNFIFLDFFKSLVLVNVQVRLCFLSLSSQVTLKLVCAMAAAPLCEMLLQAAEAKHLRISICLFWGCGCTYIYWVVPPAQDAGW